ncbi:DUF6090 family protein [Robiginitalea marina]|uniref:DUF6090 family protein n=1 Tax=Robiginitalea marina TaxID=2954105 RepID=A0ABT1B1B1_9FLAO|nr:DUF6090 family protein [Robiginitalea marina]MCO5726036.1 DUF6090 family protein [Robiginitalea marina]
MASFSMISFFRKIRQKQLQNTIGAENRVGRYFAYALGEILLVVIGILIALQINTSNEARKSRAYELTMLREVNEAMKVDYQNMSTVLLYLQRIQRSFYALTVMKNDRSVSTDSLDFHLENVREYGYVFSINTSPYEGIKSGGLDKISNPEIRNELSYLFGYLLPMSESWINEVLRVELFNRNELIDGLFYIESFPRDDNSVSSRVVIEDQSVIYTHPDFEKLIRTGWPLPGTVKRLTAIRERMQGLIRLIDTELMKS